MNITNKILKDKKTLTYTYTVECRKCGFSDKIDMPRKREIEVSRIPCYNCDVSDEPFVMIIQEPITQIIENETCIKEKKEVSDKKPVLKRKNKKSRKNK